MQETAVGVREILANELNLLKLSLNIHFCLGNGECGIFSYFQRSMILQHNLSYCDFINGNK